MTKAKVPARPAPPQPEDDLVLSETWRRRPWIPFLIGVAVVAVVFGAGLAMNAALQPAPPSALAGCKTSAHLGPHQYSGRQPICIDQGKNYTATLDTTQGTIVIRLFPQNAPVTVNNFIVLAVNGFYNGLEFWDASDWEVQGGDPGANGQGGPGYTLPDEKTPRLAWLNGSVGMARVPGGPVNGSQFFIVKSNWPNGGPTTTYNHFGVVVSGMDHVYAISAGDRINTITITVSNVRVSGSR